MILSNPLGQFKSLDLNALNLVLPIDLQFFEQVNGDKLLRGCFFLEHHTITLVQWIGTGHLSFCRTVIDIFLKSPFPYNHSCLATLPLPPIIASAFVILLIAKILMPEIQKTWRSKILNSVGTPENWYRTLFWTNQRCMLRCRHHNRHILYYFYLRFHSSLLIFYVI